MLATSLSHSFAWKLSATEPSALLVRIYPQQGVGEPFELNCEPSLVGREDAQVLLSDDSVSRRHATIQWNGAQHVVEDLGSVNGTFVNDCRVMSKELSIGDRVRFGNQLFQYVVSNNLEKSFQEIVFRIMTTDGLTETSNKQFFLQSLERELQLTARTALPMSVMLLEIDHFDSLVTSHGSLATDELLRQFAKRVQSVMRRGDLVARSGGKEFAVLCPQTELVDALRLADRIRVVVAKEPVQFEGQEIPMTVSIGLTDCDSDFRKSMQKPTSDSASSAIELLTIAHKYLNQAQQNGRDRVCFPA